MNFAVAVIGVAVPHSVARAAWRSVGPFGGGAEIVRTFSDAKDSVLAATGTGLLFLSTNGGASWTDVPFTAQSAGVLHALEIDPRSGRIWYAGVEGNSPQTSGVYRTADAGRSWSLLPGTRGIAVWSLAFWPSNPDVIAAGTGSGIYRTSDGGANWKRISPAGDPELRPVVSLAFDPQDDRVLYAGTTHLPWRTTDGGATWQSIHAGMIDDSDVFSIQVDPRRPERVLASACSGAYASRDGAQHWARLDTPKGAFRTYFIALDPAAGRAQENHPETMFAGTSDGLIRSVNGGASWRMVSRVRVKSIAFDHFVAGRFFFASPDSGLLLSTDGGNTLHESNFGFTNRAFTSLAGSGGVLYATGPSELFRSDTLGLRWQNVGSGPEHGRMMAVAAAPDASATLFAAGYTGLFESSDGGRNWRQRKGLPDGIRVKALLPRAHGALIAGTDRGIYRESSTGAWSRVSASGAGWLQSAGPHALSALTSASARVSSDDGITWRECGSPAPGMAWYGLALDPAAPEIAVAATSRGAFRSVDGCRSWTPIATGLEQATAQAPLFHPARAGEVFVAQAGRVFRSTDDGCNWQPLAGGNDLWPSALFIPASAPDRLFALVPGRGVFSITAPAPPAVMERSSKP